ncbi:MAG: hypothetical protein ACI9YU_001710 [Flavobacteriales bacterium]|jgi:hypothetical protein
MRDQGGGKTFLGCKLNAYFGGLGVAEPPSFD